MKIIELLNKIANGEEVPKKFKYGIKEFFLQDKNCYRCEETSEIFEEDFVLEDLNDEVEIIEEEKKIPEKLGYFDLTKDKNEKDENGDDLELHYTGVADTFDDIYEKINEIIDYLKSKGDE